MQRNCFGSLGLCAVQVCCDCNTSVFNSRPSANVNKVPKYYGLRNRNGFLLIFFLALVGERERDNSCVRKGLVSNGLAEKDFYYVENKKNFVESRTISQLGQCFKYNKPLMRPTLICQLIPIKLILSFNFNSVHTLSTNSRLSCCHFSVCN